MTLAALPQQHAEMPLPFEKFLFMTDCAQVDVQPIKNRSKPVTTRRKKVIKFDKVVQVHKILHIDDYTTDEIDACWYTPQEVQSIHDDINMVLDCWEQADEERLSLHEQSQESYNNDNLPCRRGLEKRFYDRRQVSKSRFLNGCFAVFEEQELQWEEEETDVEYLSRVYKVASRSSLSLEEAHKMALHDEEVVRQQT